MIVDLSTDLCRAIPLASSVGQMSRRPGGTAPLAAEASEERQAPAPARADARRPDPRIRTQIAAHKQELQPSVDEAARLQRAVDALDALNGRSTA